MVTFEELRARYPPKRVNPFGDCCIVPGAEFDPDWEAELCDLGCSVHFADLGGKPVALVYKKPIQGAGEKVVYRPPEASAPKAEETLRDRLLLGAWRPFEDEALIKLYNSGAKYDVIFEELQKRFPDRSLAAVTNRIGHLQQRGLIEARQPRGNVKRERKQDASTGVSTGRGHKKWNAQEIKLLTELWIQGLTLSKIAARFPGRSSHGVDLHLNALRRKGLIEGRVLGFREATAKQKNGEQEKEEPKLPTALPTAVRTTVYAAVYAGLDKVLVEIRDEVYAMTREHGDFRSLHEGYAVVLEELEELWDEVKRPAESRDLGRLRAEALNVAASAAKFALFVEKGLEAKS